MILVSFIAAMALRISPWPDELLVFNPDWILLLIIYWCLAIPERFGVGAAWLIGLFTDVLTGRLLGQFALAYSIVAYFSVKLHQRLRLFPFPQQIVFILCLLLLSQLLIFWTDNIQGPTNISWQYWLPSLAGAIVWPAVFRSIHWLRRSIR